LRIFPGFGVPGQQEKRRTVRLDNRKVTLEVGLFTIAPGENTREGE
jgi:hypothetical protein